MHRRRTAAAALAAAAAAALLPATAGHALLTTCAPGAATGGTCPEWTAAYRYHPTRLTAPRVVVDAPYGEVAVVTPSFQVGGTCPACSGSTTIDVRDLATGAGPRFSIDWTAPTSTVGVTASGDVVLSDVNEVVAFSGASGAPRWRTNFSVGAGGNAAATAIDAAVAGHLYVSGTETDTGGARCWFTVSLDPATGQVQWINQLPVSAASGQQPTGIALSSDGRTVIVGGEMTDSAGNSVAAVERIHAPSGEVEGLATAGLGTPGWQPYGFATDAAGDLAVLSFNGQPAAGVPAVLRTVAFDTATDSLRWSQDVAGTGWITFDLGVATGSATGTNLASASADGSSVYVASQSGAAALTVAYDGATGAIRWQHQDTSPRGNVQLLDTVLSPDGTRLAVAGVEQELGTYSGTDDLIETIDTATGQTTMQALYNGSAAGTEKDALDAVDWRGDALIAAGEGGAATLFRYAAG